MADQTISAEDTGEGRAAYDVWRTVRALAEFEGKGMERVRNELRLFQACRRAAKGYDFDLSDIK